MGSRLKPAAMYASVREYLLELEESGVDGLPFEEEGQGSRVKGQGEITAEGPGSRVQGPGATTLEELKLKWGDCRRCPLHKTRNSIVFGRGNPKSRIMFVGDAPGAEEDMQGEPFVGEAGRILTRIIEAMGLSRGEVYICNLVKCRPPEDRNPHRDEIEACLPFLQQQIRAIGPEVIVALGTFASQSLLHNKEPISKLRGRFYEYSGIKLMPTFHPSFLLRHKNDRQIYWDVWDDMVKVLSMLKLPVPEKKRKE